MSGVLGTVYLACFERRVGSGAQHYLGWTRDVEARVQAHANGKGAKLMSLVCQLGVGWSVVRTWGELTRHDERKMKNGGSLARYCPNCRDAYRKRRNEQQRRRRARDGRADRPRGNPRGPLK